MRTVTTYGIAMVGAMCLACAGTLVSVRLQPEHPTTLHVGENVVVQVAEREGVIGSAGSSLVLLKRTHQRGVTIFLYRAVKTGNHTLVVAPEHIPNGQCISCVTYHYFVTVVQ
jgi:hypothetical protein